MSSGLIEEPYTGRDLAHRSGVPRFFMKRLSGQSMCLGKPRHMLCPDSLSSLVKHSVGDLPWEVYLHKDIHAVGGRHGVGKDDFLYLHSEFCFYFLLSTIFIRKSRSHRSFLIFVVGVISAI